MDRHVAIAWQSGRPWFRALWPSVVALACATGNDVVVDGDTIRVRAHGRPAWGTDVRLIEEFTIGQLDGPPEYTLGAVWQVATDATGGFYIFDSQATQIRQYDAQGRFLRAVGRTGDGPGEYREGAALTVAQDSLLVVCDPSNRRMTSFGPDGGVRGLISMRGRSFGGPYDCMADASGLVFRRAPVRQTSEGFETPMSAAARMLRVRLDGTVVDSHYLAPRASAAMFVTYTSDGRLHAFPPESIAVPYALGGVIAGHSETYRIVVTRPGTRVLVIERRQPRIPLEGAERDEWVARIAYANRLQPGHPGPEPPREKPYFRDLGSDLSGRIWVQLYAAAERRDVSPRPGSRWPPLTWRERNSYDVFSRTGAYLGRVQLPPETMLLAIRGDRLYLRLTGPEGEHRIAVYRLSIPTLPG